MLFNLKHNQFDKENTKNTERENKERILPKINGEETSSKILVTYK